MIKSMYKEFLLSELNRFYDTNGFIPRRKDMLVKNNYPSVYTYRYYFESFGDAIRYAGLIGKPNIVKFWKYVDKKGISDCWQWNGTKDKDGYGRFFSGKHTKSHRLSYSLQYGDISEGMCVLHKCDNPSCVNPNHLFLGTHKDNSIDMVNKGRNPDIRGENNPYAKLTNEQIKEIRKLGESTDLSQQKIADKYGVCQRHISRILCNESRSSDL